MFIKLQAKWDSAKSGLNSCSIISFSCLMILSASINSIPKFILYVRTILKLYECYMNNGFVQHIPNIENLYTGFITMHGHYYRGNSTIFHRKIAQYLVHGKSAIIVWREPYYVRQLYTTITIQQYRQNVFTLETFLHTNFYFYFQCLDITAAIFLTLTERKTT